MSGLRVGIVILLVVAGLGAELAAVLWLRPISKWDTPWEWAGWAALLALSAIPMLGLLRVLAVARFRRRIVLRPFAFLTGGHGYSGAVAAKLLERQLRRARSSLPPSRSRALVPSTVSRKRDRPLLVETGDAKVSLALLLSHHATDWAQRILFGPRDVFEFIVTLDDETIIIEAVRTRDRREFAGVAYRAGASNPMTLAIKQLAEGIEEQYPGYDLRLLDQLQSQARFEDALGLVQRIADAPSDRLAWALYQAGRHGEAKKEFQTLTDSVDAAYGKAACLLALGEFEETLRLADRPEFAGTPKIRFRRAEALHSLGKEEEALASYREVIAMCQPPRLSQDLDVGDLDQVWLMVEAHQCAAECLRAMQDESENEQLGELRDLCERLDRLDLAPRHALAMCLEDLNLIDAALDAYQQSIPRSDQPEDLQAHIDSLWSYCGIVGCLMKKICAGLRSAPDLDPALGLLQRLAGHLKKVPEKEWDEQLSRLFSAAEPADADTPGVATRGAKEQDETADTESAAMDQVLGPSIELAELHELVDWTLQVESASQLTFDECASLLTARGSVNRAEGRFGLACLYASRGEIGPALNELVRAIELTPYFRERAKRDSDLDPLKGSEPFAMAVSWETTVRVLDPVEAAALEPRAEE